MLSLREKEVLYLRYGLPGGTELTQKEVGNGWEFPEAMSAGLKTSALALTGCGVGMKG